MLHGRSASCSWRQIELWGVAATSWCTAHIHHLRAPLTPSFHPQVTHEAFQDGLFTAEELAATVGELRAEYVAALAALGVDAASLPDPTTDPPRPASRTDMFKVCGAEAQAGPDITHVPHCALCFERVALFSHCSPPHWLTQHLTTQAFPDRPASSSGASSSGRLRPEPEHGQGAASQQGGRWGGRASTPVQPAEARPQSHRWGGDVSPPGARIMCVHCFPNAFCLTCPARSWMSRLGAPLQAGIRTQQPRWFPPARRSSS